MKTEIKMAVSGGRNRSGSSRSSQFIITALLVVVVLLGFNYWNTSTKYAQAVLDINKLQMSLHAMHRVEKSYNVSDDVLSRAK